MADADFILRESAIASLVQPGQPVGSFMLRVGRKANVIANEFTPFRTGALRRGNEYNPVTKPFGSDPSALFVLRNRIRYANYVHGGTTGPIRARNWSDGRPGYLGPMPPFLVGGWGEGSRAYSWEIPYARQVKGQEAQPWLKDAIEDALASEGIIVEIV